MPGQEALRRLLSSDLELEAGEPLAGLGPTMIEQRGERVRDRLAIRIVVREDDAPSKLADVDAQAGPRRRVQLPAPREVLVLQRCQRIHVSGR